MKPILPSDLTAMDFYCANEPIKIDLIYANKNHPRNIFGSAIYRPDAKLWLHRDLAAVTLLAARRLRRQHGYTLELKDGLRTTDAQKTMSMTEIVLSHPHWTMPGPRQLLSLPGGGGHPRGMAVDVCLLDENGKEIDMGVPFDYFSENPEENPASRSYTGFSDEVLENRQILEQAFLRAADDLNLILLPLHSEWWDFRIPSEIADHFAPLSDDDLPAEMRMCTAEGPSHPAPDFDKTVEDILQRISYV